MKEITVNIDDDLFFKAYLKVMSPVFNVKNRELEVLAELIRRNNELKSTPEADRWRAIFSYESRVDLASKLEMSPASLGNNLTSLRRKNVIVDNRVIDKFLIYPNDEHEFELKFKFKINGD
jgi:hypothetical protein